MGVVCGTGALACAKADELFAQPGAAVPHPPVTKKP